MFDIGISEDHPLSLELASLRETAARYQHEAHAASVKLQRHSLETSHALEQANALQHENACLREEIEVLRAHSDTTPHPAALQVPELTLALRRLSDKLTFTEETLLSRTTELTHARSDLAKTQSDTEAANALTVKAHIHVEQSQAKERELERKVRAAEEERRLADLVVQEYADLVRTLEGRKSKSPPSPSVAIHTNASGSSITLADSLAEGKLGLQKLLGEHDTEVEQLSSRVSQLVNENELLKTKLDVEQKRSEADRESLARVLLELDKHQTDDSTATKMVSRYMKFSQSTIDSLQQAMNNLRTRHTSTLATLHGQIEYLQKAFSSERRQAERLRSTLDELSEDISREAYGRRREVGLRLAFLAREEGLAENLRRWLRRSRESMDRSLSQLDHEGTSVREVFEPMLQDAEDLLESLNGQPSVQGNSPTSLAHLVTAQDIVASLTKELHEESDRRLRLQRQIAESDPSEHPIVDKNDSFSLAAPPPRHASLGKIQQDKKLPDVTGSTNTKEVESTDQAQAASTLTHSHGLAVQDNSSAPASPGNDPNYDEVRTHTPIPRLTPISTLDQSGQQAMIAQNTSHPEITLIDNVESVVTQDSGVSNPEDNTSVEISLKQGHSAIMNAQASPHIAPEPRRSVTSTPAIIPALPFPPSKELPTDQTRVSITAPEPPQLSPLETDLPTPTAPSAEDTVVPTAVEFPHQLEYDDESELSPTAQHGQPGLLFRSSSTLPPSSTPAVPESKEGLLVNLSQVKHRYQHLQKAFRDCNVTLKDLKSDLSSLPPSTDMTSIIRTAVERLDDFNEDARVELEIRVADEERVLMGYETLLSVPGALDEDTGEGKLQENIKAFIDGSDGPVAKALQQFTRKLDDLEHDIAALKRVLHELATNEDATQPSALSTPSKQGWSSWTAGILSASSRPISPAPTFGSVMTTPRTRQSSFSVMHRHSPNDSPTKSSAEDSSNPFSSLGLRIAMPAHVPAFTPARPFLSPMAGASRGPRPRVSSTSLFSLGLGSRSSSFTFSTSNSSKSPSSGLARTTEDDASESSDIDIE